MNDASIRRNDLPTRAAKRIMALLFTDLAHTSPLIEAYRAKVEKDVARAIWEEQVAMTGEREVEAREGKLPE